jgi:hypothetical protein
VAGGIHANTDYAEAVVRALQEASGGRGGRDVVVNVCGYRCGMLSLHCCSDRRYPLEDL